MNVKLFGADAKKKRMQKGYTQESFAEFVELDKNVISNLERGYKLPNRENLFTIVRALDMSIDKYLDIKSLDKNPKMKIVIDRYCDLPPKKQAAIENIFLAALDEINKI